MGVIEVDYDRGIEAAEESGVDLEVLSGFWGDAPIMQSMENLRKGYGYIERGTHLGNVTADGVCGPWMVEVTATGTPQFGSTNRVGGAIIAQSGTGDNDEVLAQLGGAATAAGGAPFHISDTGSEKADLWFEFAVMPDTIAASEMGFFVGLCETFSIASDTVIEDAGGIDTARDLIGFFKREGDAGLMDFVYQAGAQTIVIKLNGFKTLSTTVVAKFGFKLDWNAPAAERVRVYYNGVVYKDSNFVGISDTDIATATFPDSILMTPTINIKNAEAATHNIVIPFVGCYAKRVR